jgi:hypothetical protein
MVWASGVLWYCPRRVICVEIARILGSGELWKVPRSRRGRSMRFDVLRSNNELRFVHYNSLTVFASRRGMVFLHCAVEFALYKMTAP